MDSLGLCTFVVLLSSQDYIILLNAIQLRSSGTVFLLANYIGCVEGFAGVWGERVRLLLEGVLALLVFGIDSGVACF